MAQLVLPHAVKDNLSDNFQFFIPSPTVQSDKIFYSSDSDWDEVEGQDHDTSNIALVPCERCGHLELRPLPGLGEKYVCVVCREERQGHRVVGLEFQLQEQENKKKRRKRKKKAPVTHMVEADLMAFEGTPEGVKVYRLKEESHSQVDIFVKDNNNEKGRGKIFNSNKTSCANLVKQSFKVRNDFEVPYYDTDQSSEEEDTIAEKEPKEVESNEFDEFSLNRLLLQTGLLMIVVFYKSCQNGLYFLGERLRNYLSDAKFAFLEWWNNGAPKPGKYSRRRKILK